MRSNFYRTNYALTGGLTLAAFTAVALDIILAGPLSAFEQRIAPAIDYRALPDLASPMLALSYLGSTAVVAIVAGFIALVLLCERLPRPAFMLGAAVYGGMFFNAALKQVFQRARPIVEDPLLLLPSYSFPSGHAMASTLLYASLAILAAHALQRRAARILVMVCAGLLIAAIGASRVYLGVHYLTDVLAGVLVAVAWLLLCHTFVYAERERGSPRPD